MTHVEINRKFKDFEISTKVFEVMQGDLAVAIFFIVP